LTRNPDLVAIFCSNDTMALGAVEAAYAAGKGDKITIIGFDGTVDAVKSIKDGRLGASVAQLPYLVGSQAVEKTIAVLAGGTADEMTYVPTLVLTKQLFSENKDPLLQYLR
jgi:D-allose transport system substrate-binding protein